MKPLVLLLPLSSLSPTRKKATTLAWPSFFAFDEFTRYNLAGDEKGRGPNDPKKDLNEQANNVVVKAEPSQALVDDHFLTLVKQSMAEDRVALTFLKAK